MLKEQVIVVGISMEGSLIGYASVAIRNSCPCFRRGKPVPTKAGSRNPVVSDTSGHVAISGLRSAIHCGDDPTWGRD